MTDSATARPPVVVQPGTAEALILGRSVPRVLLSGTGSQGRLAVLEVDQGAGGGPPLHTHSREDEAFYVLGGEFSFTCGASATRATAGCFALLPRGTPHRYEAGIDGGRLLILFTPAGMENYFRDWASLIATDQMTDPAMSELAGHYGLTLHNTYLPPANQTS